MNVIFEPNKVKCELDDAESPSGCVETNVQCQDFDTDKQKCLSAEPEDSEGGCFYHEYENVKKCMKLTIEEDCNYDKDNNRCSLSAESNKFICEIEVKTDYVKCKKRQALCSDFDEDEDKCLQLILEGTNKKCSYDSSRSSGSKCFEVLIENGCTFDNSQKKCTGNDLPNGKICDLDFSMNPVNCGKRNAQCNDFNEDKDNCESVILQDITKLCSYNENTKDCSEQMREAKCTFETDRCTNSFPLKIKCTLNEESNGCIEENVECGDFEDNEGNCNLAVISDSKKKCKYDANKSQNKCYEEFKECNDLYNERDCNNYKPQDKLSKCVWSTECKEKKCQTTDINNCGSYKPNDSQYQCTLNKEKTQCEEKLKAKEETNGAEKLSLILLIFALLIIA